MIKSGTTTFSDMYFYMDGVAQAVEEIGMRAVLSYGMIDFGIEEKRENEFKENIALVKDHNNTADGRITTMFGPHSIYTTSPELLERVRKEADKYQVGIHIHMNETMKEINDCKEAHQNKRPFEYLDDLGILGSDIVAAHAVWLDQNEIDLIKKYDVKVSHNPCSNMKLASGASPIGELLKQNICVGLGTPKLATADEVINMATYNGAKALGIDAGAIEVGKKADLILVDTNAPNMTPMSNALSSNLVYSANGSNVDTTICNGKILMENRKLLTVDEGHILSEAKRAIAEMKELRESESDE